MRWYYEYQFNYIALIALINIGFILFFYHYTTEML